MTAPAPVLSAILERKFVHSAVELRTVKGDKKIAGYGAVFNSLSKPLGGFKEVVSRSAFNKAKSDNWPNVICRFNHDSNMLLGTTEANTLSLRIDETGLEYEVIPPDGLSLVREWVERGDVRRSSFAFRTVQDDWTTSDGGYPIRSLVEVKLVDVSPVTDPAYEATTAGMRGLDPKMADANCEISAGHESLAVRVGASVEEVQALAIQDELRKFFIRTDMPTPAKPAKPPMFGPAAAAQMELERMRQGW